MGLNPRLQVSQVVGRASPEKAQEVTERQEENITTENTGESVTGVTLHTWETGFYRIDK